jgi:chromate transporter
MSQEPSPSIAGLEWTFLRIGAMAFGGLGATLALIERELVSRQGVLARDALTESLTYTKLLPGSTVVQVVSYLGWRLGGWRGSAVATAAFLLPSAIAMLALSYGYTQLARAPAAGSGVRGMIAVVVGLLLVTLSRVSRPVLRTPLALALAAAAFVVVAALQVHAAWVVLTAGLIGVLVRRWPDALR